MVVVVVVVAETGSGPDGALLLQADTRRRAPGHDVARRNRRVASLQNTRIVKSAMSERCLSGRALATVVPIASSTLAEGFGERPLASVDFWKADRRFVSTAGGRVIAPKRRSRESPQEVRSDSKGAWASPGVLWRVEREASYRFVN
jgi:hypothetical protein